MDRLLNAALVHSLATESDPICLSVGFRRGMVQFTLLAPGLALDQEVFAPLRGPLQEALELGRHDQRCLPLATARALIELQGGCLWTAEAGGETAICVALPAARKAPAPAEREVPNWNNLPAPEPN